MRICTPDAAIPDWRPGASLDTLERAAALRDAIRGHMRDTGALEVCTPVLSRAAATEPAIESFETVPTDFDGRWYLQTSPEFPMKRLVAACGRDVWQLAPVFRREERGRRHNPEFSLLEWYRVGRDLDALMDDVEALWRRVSGAPGITVERFEPLRADRRSYGELVLEVSGDYPEALDVARIERLFARHGRSYPAGIGDDLDAALDLLVDEFVLPTLPTNRPTFIVGYPPSQASLARVTTDAAGREVAARFELYVGPTELANGFDELIDAAEQRARFEADLDVRRERGQPMPPLDERLLAALEHGLPTCAGVALGVDRLLMVLTGAAALDEVMAFDGERA